jgi:hypothetical protein
VGRVRDLGSPAVGNMPCFVASMPPRSVIIIINHYLVLVLVRVTPIFAEVCICLRLLISANITYQINIDVVGMIDRLLFQLNIPAEFPGKLVFVTLLMPYIGAKPSM